MLKFLGKGENFVYVACCIGAALLLLAFFTKDIPYGQYVTNQVKVYDQANKEYLYLNLVVDVENDCYFVREVISPTNGKVIEADYSGNTFGQKCNFTLVGEERSLSGRLTAQPMYSVTITQKDLPVSALDRIQNDFFNFAVRAALLAFLIFTTYNANKKPKNTE
jgi:hypothetical protein